MILPVIFLRSIDTWRLHQRKQFIDSDLCYLSHPIGVIHSGNVNAFYNRLDLIAEIGEEGQGSGELLATRAIKPVIKIWQAIMRPFSSSIMHPCLLCA